MFWIFNNVVKMSANFVIYMLKITSEIMALIPMMGNLLLLYSFIRLTSSSLVKLLDLCKYLTKHEKKRSRNNKRRNTVSFLNDTIAISEKEALQNDKETKVVSNQESSISTYKNTRDYWNKVPNLSVLNGEQRKSKSNLKKTKSLDYLTYMINQLDKGNPEKEERYEVREGSERVPNNTYGKVKHETVFINNDEEESSDDLELLSSDDESVNDSKVNVNHFIHQLSLLVSE